MSHSNGTLGEQRRWQQVKQRRVQRPSTHIPPAIWQAWNIPEPVAEYRWCGERRWRLDYAWVEQRVAVEIEGGVWVRGRHTRPSGFLRDMEKYNRLAVDGWCLLRYPPGAVDFREIREALARA